MSKYSFTFEALVADVPYTNLSLRFEYPTTLALSFGSILLYLVLIYAITPVFTPTTPYGKGELHRFSKVHFSLLCVYSAICCLSTFYHIAKEGELSNWSGYLCAPIPEWLRLLSLSFALSKIWEWVDTFIDIWRGKTPYDIGFLHCYHHATTFFLFLLVENFPGTEKSGMLMNGFVHTLMYYHYAFRLPKFMRPLITAAQIVQLVTVTYIWHITPQSCQDHSQFPKDHLVEFLIPYGFVPVYTIFFVKFFAEAYLFPSKKGRKD